MSTTQARATSAVFVATIICASAAAQTQSPTPPTTTALRLGHEGRVIYRYTPENTNVRSLLRPAALERGAPLALRIAGVERDGEADLYDLRVIAEIPGEFDLAAFLERDDGGSMRHAPAVWFTATDRLPPDHELTLSEDPDLVPTARVIGGYRTALIVLGALWLAVPGGVALYRAVRAARAVVPVPPPPAPTLADQLRPLIEGALTGSLSLVDRARLEMLLIASCRERLTLEGLAPTEALSRIRRDPDAGALLTAVERWLHAPASRTASDEHTRSDAARLLERFRAWHAVPDPKHLATSATSHIREQSP